MKIKHLLFLLAAVPLLGGAAVFPKFDHGYDDAALVLEGEIASQPVTVFLTIPTLINEKGDNTNISGYYYYDLHKKNIELSGSITNIAKEEGVTIYRAVITESDGLKDTGVFTLDINSYAGTAKGSWNSLPAKKEFAVSLVPSAKLPFNKITFTKASSGDSMVVEDEEEWKGTFSAEISFFSLENTKSSTVSPILKKINTLALGDFSEESEILVRLFKAIKKHYDDWYPEGSYSVSESYGLSYADPRLLGLLFVQDLYGGGAHGVVFVGHLLYSLETGESLNDVRLLVNNPQDPRLIALLRQKLTNENRGSDMREDDYFDFEKIRLNDNFSIQDGGVLFTYNQYEVAAYVYGHVEVFFSFKELAPFARKKGPFAHLFTDKP